jgi:hypothetical protein
MRTGRWDEPIQDQRPRGLAHLVDGTHLFSYWLPERLSVVLSSGWNYLNFQRGTRLITGLKAREWRAWLSCLPRLLRPPYVRKQLTKAP